MRRVLALALATALLSTALVGCGGGAKGPPDLSAGLPEGVTIVPIAGGVTNELPPTPVRLVLERIAINAATSMPMRVGAGPELLYVESGSVVVADELGIEGVYAEGAQHLAQFGTPYAIRNDQEQPASLLRLRLAPAATEVVVPVTGTPVRGRSATGEVRPVTLLADDVKALPMAPAFLFLAHVTWAPGARLEEHIFSGPVGLVLESGALTVVGPSGVRGIMTRETSSVLFPSGSPNQEWNEGIESAVVLMAGVVAMDQEFVRDQ